MTDNLSADISALIKKLDEPATTVPARLIVATDWSQGAMPLTALRAFRTLVPSNAPIHLIFAVPHEPTPADAACVEILADEVGGGVGLANLDVQSFEEVLEQPYDSALVPVKDPEANLVQLGGFILRMRDLMRSYEASRGGAAGTGAVTRNPGDHDALKQRLADYTA